MAVITRLYEDYTAARRALDAVTALRLDGVEGSILGNESVRDVHEDYQRQYSDGTTEVRVEEAGSGAATGAGVGAALGGGAGLLAGLGMLAIPGLGPLVAAGWLAATAAGAAGGALAGGAIGALTDLGVSDEDAPVYGEAVRRGGVMVSVRAPAEHVAQVEGALETVPTAPIHDLRSRYEADGWHAAETDAERAERIRRETPLM